MTSGISARGLSLLRWLLLASLALNLLVGGLVLGAWLSDGPPGRPPRPVELAQSPIVRALAPEDRRAVLESLRDRADLGSREEWEADLAALVAALRADPFDAGAFERAVAAQAERVSGLEAAVQAALLDHLGALPAEERGRVADRLLEDMARQAERRGPPGGPRDD